MTGYHVVQKTHPLAHGTAVGRIGFKREQVPGGKNEDVIGTRALGGLRIFGVRGSERTIGKESQILLERLGFLVIGRNDDERATCFTLKRG
jgi:hypothetical protein